MIHRFIFCTVLLLSANLAVAIETETLPQLTFLSEQTQFGKIINEQGESIGASAELVQKLMMRLDEPGEIIIMPWARAFNMASSQPQMVLLGTIRSAEREPLFKWVGPLLRQQLILYGRKGVVNPELGLGELLKKHIACETRNTSIVRELENMGFIKDKNLILTLRAGDCYTMLEKGRADMTVINRDIFETRLAGFQQAGLELIPVMPVAHSYQYLAFSTDVDDDRITRWQNALEQSYLDGTMRRLYQEVYPEELIAWLENFARQKQAVADTAK